MFSGAEEAGQAVAEPGRGPAVAELAARTAACKQSQLFPELLELERGAQRLQWGQRDRPGGP